MYQPYPAGGEPAGPLPSSVPAPVRTAVKLMYAGAAVSAVNLISGLVFIIGGNKAGHAVVNGRILTAAQASQLDPVLITVAIVSGLVVIGLWLWMARANGQGRNWARILSTVLFALAALQVISQASVRQPVSHPGFAVMVFGVIVPVLALVGRRWPRCGCCGARPPARSSSRRASPRPGTAHSRVPGRASGQGRAGTLLVRVIRLDPLVKGRKTCCRTRAVTRNATG